LTDKFGIDDDDSDIGNDDDDERRGAAKSKSFQLLNELSDLLMLPKDMLLEKSIRKEVSFTHSNWQIIILFPLLRDNQMTRLCL